MENYYYDENGVYTGSIPAHEGSLPPDNAIRAAPEFRDGFCPVLNDSRDGWILVEDNRGRQGWVDGVAVVVGELGPLPENWRENGPTLEEMLRGDVQALRRATFAGRVDPIRDLALSYRLEAEAWKRRGDTVKAREALAKSRQELTRYLDEKEAVRREYPKADAGTENASESGGSGDGLYYVNHSGVWHRPECGFARGNGEWMTRDKIDARADATRPCRRCRPDAGE